MTDAIEIAIKVEGSKQGVEALNKLKESLANVDKAASTANARREMQAFSTVAAAMQREGVSALKTLGISTSLLSGGIVAGLVMAGKALADFGRQGLQLSYLAKELNVSTEALTRWKLMGQAAGVSSERSAADVENALKKIQSLQFQGGQSALFNELVKAGADNTGRALAAQLYEVVTKTNDPGKAFEFLQDKLAQFAKAKNYRAVSAVLQVFGMERGWENAAQHASRFGKIVVVDAAAAAEFQLRITLLGASLDVLSTTVGNKLLGPFTQLTQRLDAWLKGPDGELLEKKIEELGKSLEDLPWDKIETGAKATLSGLGSLFDAARKTFADDYADIQKVLELYDKLQKYQEKTPLERLQERQKEERPGTEVFKDFWNRMWKKPGTTPDNNTPQRFGNFSGGEADGLTRFNERRETEDLTDQMRDVTDEVRRLNDLIRGSGGSSLSGTRGGAGGMGDFGRGGGGSGRRTGSPFFGGGGGRGRQPGGSGGTGSSGLQPEGGEGAIPKADLRAQLENEIAGSDLNGFVPPDGERYGIKTGAPKEWAHFMTELAGRESSYSPKTHGDVGRFGGAGSHGLFQLSPQDAITYGLQKEPFTLQQLRDPAFNAKTAVQIAAIRAKQGGIGGKEGMAKYWGPIQRGWRPGGLDGDASTTDSTGTSGSPTSPEAIKARTGDPSAFIMHHTSGRGTIEGVQSTLRQRGLGVQYIMDREGNIVAAGGPGASHMKTGWGDLGRGLSNRNTVGMEVIARNNRDVSPEQVAAAQEFIRKNYPNTPVLGHGQVNPGHKEADEGMKIVNAINREREEARSYATARGTAVAFTANAMASQREAESDRKHMDTSLVHSISQNVMKGRAAIDIDVGGVKGSEDESDNGLFKTTRSKAAPAMPNTIGGADGDKSSTSEEE